MYPIGMIYLAYAWSLWDNLTIIKFLYIDGYIIPIDNIFILRLFLYRYVGVSCMIVYPAYSRVNKIFIK